MKTALITLNLAAIVLVIMIVETRPISLWWTLTLGYLLGIHSGMVISFIREK